MRLNEVLWIVQALLTLLFLFADGLQLLLSVDPAAVPVLTPNIFMHIIDVPGSTDLATSV